MRIDLGRIGALYVGGTGRLPITGLLTEAPGGWGRPFWGAGIDIGHEKKVDLGVLRGADHDGRVQKLPFSTVDRVCVEFKVTP